MGPPPEKDPLIGRDVGHCRIQRKLGQGGMGAVYLAHHTGLNKSVAIKVLPPGSAGNPDFIARFLREARLAARLEHPNVVQVFDVGEEGGLYYISMQYVEGRSLEAILKERKKFSVPEAVAIAKRVAVALAAAHKMGIVHRDIKPANILLSKDGVIKVADFGLAKDKESNASISETGQIVGTPYYMSPEQAQGETLDARSDLYSLGATLYHMVTGQRAFEGHTPLSIVIKHVSQEPVPPREVDPSIPENVCAVIARLMKKRPAERYASAEELIRDLDALKQPAGSGVRTEVRPPPRRAAMVALPLAAILVVGIVIGIVLGRGDPATPAAVHAPAPPAPAPKAAPAAPKPPAPKPPEPPPEPPPAPKPPDPAPEPPRPPADPRAGILARIKDLQERRQTEELMARVENFLHAAKKKDLKAVRGYLDRFAFGELSDAAAGELLAKVLGEKAELDGWEFEDVQVRTRPFQRPGALVTMVYRLKVPKGELKAEGTQYWVHRLTDGWVLTKPPKSADK
jgi:serine/threonine-protein kinase